MPYRLLMDGSRRTLMNGTGSLLLMGDGDAPSAGPSPITATYRERREQRHTLTWKDGQ